MDLTVGLTPVEMHDQLLASMVDGARHDQSLCPFCRGGDTATEVAQPHASVPSGSEPSGAPQSTTTPTTEGGTQDMSGTATAETLSRETHEALLSKAVTDAVSITEKALETKTTEAATATARVTELEAELATAKEDNARLNKDLDSAQVDLKKATDEVSALKDDVAAKEEAARIAELASKRTDEVKALKVFPDDYVSEKASVWAELSDDDWAARLDEWAKAAPVAKKDGEEDKATERASAMSGTTGGLTTDEASSEETKPARRAVLGL